MMAYFFDTYAIIEVIDGNQAYSRFSSEPMHTTLLNLGELHYFLLRKGTDRAVIDTWYERLKPKCIDIGADDIKKAMDFKFVNKKRKLSFIDCVGYTVAKENGLIFLTGDEGFRGFENVELVR
jgi:predicted nucleic acid-binding protein